MSILFFILLLSFLVIIHELGHYLAAKWAKIKVHEFGVGYPPRALTLFTRWGTVFSLNWIPIGGFVKMEGEENPTGPEEETKKVIIKPQQEAPFYQKTTFQRLVVLLAGVTFNFLFGILAFSIVFSAKGIPTEIPDARIGYVAPDSPAAKANVPTNVSIIAIRDGETIQSISTQQQAVAVIRELRGKTVSIVTTGNCIGRACQESAQEFEVYIRTLEETPQGEGSLGVAFDNIVFEFYPWYEMPFRGIAYGTRQAVFLGVTIITTLGTMLLDGFSKGVLPQDLAGPVGIVHQAQKQGLLTSDIFQLLHFAGMLSVNLAIMNLLPIPVLDGGRVVFVLLEKVIGRKRVATVESYANVIGYITLVGLILIVSIRDILTIFKG